MDPVELVETGIPGCHQLNFPCQSDLRGSFVKPFRESTFAQKGLATGFSEIFYTVSGPNVLRGMHIQLPPADHAKLVYCLTGKIMDVVLDVRRGSPTYGVHEVFELDASCHRGVYLPCGVAHGFYVLVPPATTAYLAGAEHSPGLDVGISWNSFGAPWPVDRPVLSPRDAALPRFEEFISPFRYPGSVETDK